MQKAESYVILGPSVTLHKFIPSITDETSPKFLYKYESEETGESVYVFVFEEQKKVTNESQCLTLVVESSERSVKIELMPSGGRTGFRGGSTDGEPPVYDQVKDFILDFTKRFGLTIQDNKQEEVSEEEENKDK